MTNEYLWSISLWFLYLHHSRNMDIENTAYKLRYAKWTWHSFYGTCGPSHLYIKSCYMSAPSQRFNTRVANRFSEKFCLQTRFAENTWKKSSQIPNYRPIIRWAHLFSAIIVCSPRLCVGILKLTDQDRAVAVCTFRRGELTSRLASSRAALTRRSSRVCTERLDLWLGSARSRIAVNWLNDFPGRCVYFYTATTRFGLSAIHRYGGLILAAFTKTTCWRFVVKQLLSLVELYLHIYRVSQK